MYGILRELLSGVSRGISGLLCGWQRAYGVGRLRITEITLQTQAMSNLLIKLAYLNAQEVQLSRFSFIRPYMLPRRSCGETMQNQVFLRSQRSLPSHMFMVQAKWFSRMSPPFVVARPASRLLYADHLHVAGNYQHLVMSMR